MGAKSKNNSKANKATVKKSRKQSAFQWGKLFKDKLFRWFAVMAVILGLGSLALLALRVRPVDYAVPLQYYSPQGFDSLGAWYRVYAFGAFALITSIGNMALAAISYDKSRIASFFLVLGTLVINLFLVIIIITLTNNLGA